MAVKPRVALEEEMLIKNFPIHADAILTATVIGVGDLLRYESDGTATASGVGLFDLATEDEKWVGVSKGKTDVNHVSGAYGDHIPVVIRGIMEVTLTSANYNYGAALGWTSSNTLVAAHNADNPTIAWFYGSDADSITKGLVYFDTTQLLPVPGSDVIGGLFKVTA